MENQFPIDPENRTFEKVKPINDLDGYGNFKQKEARIRESWIRIMEKKILEDHLADCIFKNQVNAPVACRPLAIALSNKMAGSFITKSK